VYFEIFNTLAVRRNHSGFRTITIFEAGDGYPKLGEGHNGSKKGAGK
jgi:hypothetical protein